MTSLRLRLFAALSLALLVALGAGGTLLQELVARGLREEVDERLDANLLPALEAIGERADGRPDDEESESQLSEVERRLEDDFADERSNYLFQAFAGDGAVVVRSPSLGERSLARPEPFDGERRHYDLELPGGGRARAVAVHAGERTVVLAAETGTMERRLASLRNLLLVVGAVTWLSAALVGAFALERGLAPFSRFVARVERVDPDGEGERFDAASLPVELAPIAGKLEQLLARLRAALARERRFNAAVAHELRTPVAELRAVVDVALAGGRDAGSLELALKDVDGATRHLDALVRALLSLRRGDHAASAPSADPAAPIGVREQIVQAVARAAARPDRSGTAGNATPPIVVTGALGDEAAAGDASRLRAILDNLLANAVEYAPPGTTITVDATAAAARFAVAVRNRRPDGLAKSDLERFFEPFWSRTPHGSATPHSGLGLFIARSFAEASGWRLAARLDADEVVVELSGPCAATTASRVSA